MNSANDWILEPKTIYEFTISGTDNVQLTTFNELKNRYKRNRRLLWEILKESKVKYKLLPEITMPQYGRANKNSLPRIHWHGVIAYPDDEAITNWLLIDAVKLAKYGSYQMNVFRPEYWPGYCLKHHKLFSKTLGSYELQNSYAMDKWFE